MVEPSPSREDYLRATAEALGLNPDAAVAYLDQTLAHNRDARIVAGMVRGDWGLCATCGAPRRPSADDDGAVVCGDYPEHSEPLSRPAEACRCAAHTDPDADCTCSCPLVTHVGDISEDGPCR